MISASSLERVLACPASETLPHYPEQSGAAATRGTAIHAYLAAIVDGTPRDEALALEALGEHRAFCETIDLATVPVGALSEVSWIYDTRTETARVVSAAGRSYVAQPWEIPGTCDVLVTPVDARPEVIDWKTGYQVDPNESRTQLEHYALCVADELWCDEVLCTVAVVRDDGSIERSSWIVGPTGLALARARAQRAVAEVARATAPPRLGDHCRYCPAWRGCPAHRAAVQSLLPEGVDERLVDVSIAAAYASALAAERSAAAVRTLLKNRLLALEQPVAASDGRVYYLDGRGALRSRRGGES